MRIWHYKIIKYLPNSQLLSQWRELNSIFKKQDKHILINYIYDYPKSDLYLYTIMVIREMQKRKFKIKSLNNVKDYFDYNIEADLKSAYDYDIVMNFCVFTDHHTEKYLIQCYYNLQEKFDRGQKDFSKELYDQLTNFISCQN